MQEPRLPFPFDFRKPDYPRVFQHRLGVLQRIRQNPGVLPQLFAFYRDNPVQFVIDWGCTYDPRLAAEKKPAVIPFLLFPRQIEWMQWVLGLLGDGLDGINDKSRDVGASWLAVSLSASLCLFRHDFAVGFGSRKEEYVDKLDSPKALFYKARMFLRLLPPEFRRGWNERTDAPHMRIKFTATGSVMTGEAGDNIGRGDRTSIYFGDESAHWERPELIEASLSATTNCRIDMSSVNGMQNPFAVKRHSWPARQIFTFHWRQDPRKDEAWYERQKLKTPDPRILAQEVDISYTASVSGTLIPTEWVQAAVDAHKKLGFEPVGARAGALDIADEGFDLNAFAARHGVVLYYVDAWSGKGSDIYGTVERAFDVCDAEGLREFRYDSDGLGAGARGDARKINEDRAGRLPAIEAEPFRGSESPVNPDDPIPTAVVDSDDRDERTNKDFLKNRKAQGWWDLRVRFQRTYRAVVEGHKYDASELISISSQLPRLAEVCQQFSQPTYSKDGAGRILIDKQPDGAKSPNDADAVMICYAPGERKPRSFFD